MLTKKSMKMIYFYLPITHQPKAIWLVAYFSCWYVVPFLHQTFHQIIIYYKQKLPSSSHKGTLSCNYPFTIVTFYSRYWSMWIQSHTCTSHVQCTLITRNGLQLITTSRNIHLAKNQCIAFCLEHLRAYLKTIAVANPPIHPPPPAPPSIYWVHIWKLYIVDMYL